MNAVAPVAQSDRAPASGAGCTGSSPVGGAIPSLPTYEFAIMRRSVTFPWTLLGDQKVYPVGASLLIGWRHDFVVLQRLRDGADTYRASGAKEGASALAVTVCHYVGNLFAEPGPGCGPADL